MNLTKQLKSLEGLSKFLGMGTLNLYGNDINWSELEKIRHLHIVDLILLSNPKLDKDPYCEYSVILFSIYEYFLIKLV